MAFYNKNVMITKLRETSEKHVVNVYIIKSDTFWNRDICPATFDS